MSRNRKREPTPREFRDGIRRRIGRQINDKLETTSVDDLESIAQVLDGFRDRITDRLAKLKREM